MAEIYGFLISLPCACGAKVWLMRCALVRAQQSSAKPHNTNHYDTRFFSLTALHTRLEQPGVLRYIRSVCYLQRPPSFPRPLLAEIYGFLISLPCACGAKVWSVRCALVRAQHAAQGLTTPIVILFFEYQSNNSRVASKLVQAPGA